MTDEAGLGAGPRPRAVLLRRAGDMIAWHGGSQQEATARNCSLSGMMRSSHGYHPCAGVSRQRAMVARLERGRTCPSASGRRQASIEAFGDICRCDMLHSSMCCDFDKLLLSVRSLHSFLLARESAYGQADANRRLLKNQGPQRRGWTRM